MLPRSSLLPRYGLCLSLYLNLGSTVKQLWNVGMCWQFSEPQFLHLCNGILLLLHIMCPGLLTHSRCLANGNYFTPLLRFEKRRDEVGALNPTLQRTQGLSRPRHSQASSPWGIRMPASTLATARCRATLWPPASPGHLAVTSPPHLRRPRPGLHRLCFLSLAQLLPVTADMTQRRDLPSFQGGWQCLPSRGLWGLHLDNTSHPEEMFADG